MLEVRNISVSYGKHEALHQVSLQVQPGELVVMLGANGAGKSSLLKALGGMVTPQAGASAQLAGQELMQLPRMPSCNRAWPWCPRARRVRRSQRQGKPAAGCPAPARTRQRGRNLEQVFALFPKLRDRLPQVVRTMSGGEQQMVAVGRALMSQPDILLLDEPSLGLSPLMCKELFAALARIKTLGMGVLLVEQNARQSLAIADRGYLLETGRIVGEGSAQNSATAPRAAMPISAEH
jgi:branched-chain amino acid transport system ATP-binding protein